MFNINHRWNLNKKNNCFFPQLKVLYLWKLQHLVENSVFYKIAFLQNCASYTLTMYKSQITKTKDISRNVANTMAACIFDTRLAYCNALLQGTTDKLQIVQNKLARAFGNVTTRQQHTIDLFRNLHLLPIRSRITFKVAILCYKAYRLHQPNYLLDTLKWYVHAVNWDQLRWTCRLYQGRIPKQRHAISLLHRQQFGTDFHCPSITLSAS